MVFRIPGKTNALPHSHKRRWLSASPEKQMPFRIPTKGDGFPHPRKTDDLPHPCKRPMAFRILRILVGADALIGPLHRLPLTSRPAAAKREATQCDNHPDKAGTIRHGTAVTGIAEELSVPEGGPKSALAPIRRLPSARRATAPERAKRFSLWTVRLRSRWRLCRLRMRHTPCGYGPFSFPQDGKGAPAAPRAVGRGGAPKPTKWARKCPWGARERAQFSHWGPRRAPRGGESRSSEVNEFWPAWPERGMRSL